MKYLPDTNSHGNTDKTYFQSQSIYKAEYKAGIPVSITSSLVA